MKPDYYKILGLQPGATSGEIKKSYRQLALKYHPDRNPNNEESEEQFKWVTEAYQILNDPHKRDEYDRMFFSQYEDVLRDFKHDEERFFYPPANDMLGDFFRGFYSRLRGSSRPKSRTGEDLRYNLKISFIEAALGADVTIKVPYQKECTVCQGSGTKAGSSSIKCSTCNGRGQIKSRQDSLEYLKICHTCGGKGTVASAPCAKCSGSGKTQSSHAMVIPVPPGVETGARLRVRGQGLTGKHGGAAGDLIVVIDVLRHPILERSGLDIICEVPVPLFTTLTRGTIEIPMLEGKKKIKVPPGTQTARQISLPGKGIFSPGKNKRGNLIVRLTVELPRKLSKKDRALVTEMAKHHYPEAYPATQRFAEAMDNLYHAKK